ncbi:RelA/SpoT family protein [Membranicola marinus]|uniref:RelA/SpoT family protein n=1 Tax=Membranihabitans marinus TaxID=1227546 RepID=A0A953LEF3_9BACT|nr:RelA/SpoT family protein [Membranihabitans marinus]MBY5959894.1 RelA/SpoT family protein [Membranihabitans marinus]
MAVKVTYQDKELLEVQAAFDGLMQSLEGKMDGEDEVLIRKAFEIASESHADQKRKSGELFIFHPIEVARICVDEMGLGPTAIMAALLHDTVEDTSVTLEDLEAVFGKKVSLLVDGLTKLAKSYQTDTPQAENFRKVLSTLLFDVRVVLIKMADRLHNMRTIKSMPREKQLKIAAETSYIYAPVAHRLGFYNLRTEFQDISLKVVEPDTYKEIAKKLNQTKTERDEYIEAFIDPLRSSIDGLNVPYRITGRPKSISSIYNKIKKKNVPFEEIYDLFAVRIIVDVPHELEKQTCWQIYSIVTDVHTPIPERLKDFISTPKSNGYESLHTTVIGPKGRYVEVQIRSERMDEVAERGFAAHWKYKGISNHNHFDPWLDSIREILEDKEKDAIEFINDFKNNLFSEEVFVYTPMGEVKVLPKGATALDFAFSIHTDIGYHCIAVKVNKKLVPMGYELQNGDQIHVTTSKNQKPTEDWLKLVVTPRARSRIKSAIKEEKKRIGELGKEALQRKLRNLKLDFEKNIDIVVEEAGYDTRADLYYDIAQDNISIPHIFKKIEVEDGEILEQESKEESKVHSPPLTKKSRKKRAEPVILLNDEPGEKFQYSFANCCNPVNGDKIFGFITTKEGIKIHRYNCPNAQHLLSNYGYRIMKADWANNMDKEFVADLKIVGIDQGVGVIQNLTKLISNKFNLNIRSFHIEGEEGYFEAKISLLVHNTHQLQLIMQSLKSMDGISNVSRIE